MACLLLALIISPRKKTKAMFCFPQLGTVASFRFPDGPRPSNMSIAFSNGLVVDVDLYPDNLPPTGCTFSGIIPNERNSRVFVHGCLKEDVNTCTSQDTCARFIRLHTDRDGGGYLQYFTKRANKLLTIKHSILGEYWLKWLQLIAIV